MEIIKPGRRFDFMGKRRYFYALSAVLFAVSLFAIFVKPGPNWGTDFKGGTEVEVTLTSEAAIAPADVRKAVEESGFAAPHVVSSEEVKNRFVIRVQEVSALSEDAKAKLEDALCFSDAASKDTARCPAGSQPTEVKFSPGGDKISVRYESEPEIAAIGKVIAGLDVVQLREAAITEGWPATRTDYEARFGTLGRELGKDGEGWPPSAVAFAAKFGYPPGSITSPSSHDKDRKIEIHLKSKGDQILDGLRSKLGVGIVAETANVQWIGPSSSDELRTSAFKSIFVAVFFIMAYTAVRFDLRFAPGAIVSLAHDVLIAIGAMCLFQKEITLSTIAAVLTVLGYSTTDTVVVYDRIRENLGKHRNMTLREIVNLSVSEMFGRTILTSSSAALSMVCFLVFGTQAIKDFAFVFLVGVGVCTYSSIYVAAPVTEWIDRRFFAGKAGPRGGKPLRKRARKRSESVV